MDRRADNVSLDLLSRVLVDVQMDSSRIMDDLFTTYQRSLMDMLFMGDTINRTKVMLLPALPDALDLPDCFFFFLTCLTADAVNRTQG